MAKQTECRRGHDLSVPGNRYTYPNGIKTQCMVCVRQSQARRKVGAVHARAIQASAE